jgi:hypothetical protein
MTKLPSSSRSEHGDGGASTRSASRFQDYRALAEALRVQVFWAAATPEAVADSYLRKQSGELGWIQFALRGPALWATAAALALGRPCRDYVTHGWMNDRSASSACPATLKVGRRRSATARRGSTPARPDARRDGPSAFCS